MASQLKPHIYIIDSSSLITLNRFNSEAIEIPERIWKKLNELLESGEIMSNRYVYDEIVTDSKNPDRISAWLKPKKSFFPNSSKQQVIYMAEAVNLFPGLVDPNSEKEQADAWLVSMAREKLEQDIDHEYVIVSQEKKSSPIKIPAACKHYGVRCINLKEFFVEVGIVLESS